MDCRILHNMFENNDKVPLLSLPAHLLDTLLTLGQVRRITFEFLDNYCSHSTKPSQIYWREIPILRIKCLGTETDIRIQNNKREVIFFLLKNIVQLPSVDFTSILLELRLPSWKQSYEFIFVLSKEGKMLITPTIKNISAIDLKKLAKYINTQAKRLFVEEDNEDLLDILLPDTLLLRDFKIRI